MNTMQVRLVHDASSDTYGILMPTGNLVYWGNQQRSQIRQIWAYAMAAMPVISKAHRGLGKYGQQSALARALGYKMASAGKNANRPNHARIYNLFVDGQLPRDADKRAKLFELAAIGKQVLEGAVT